MTDSVADRDLLLAVRVIERGLVAADALIVAMRAWVRDESKPLGQILVEHGVISGETHELLAREVERQVGYRAGFPAAIVAESETIAGTEVRHGQAETVTNVSIADDDSIPSLTQPEPIDGSGTLREVHGPWPPGRRYRIVRVLARGGLGEIFIGHDEELRREVALKLIQARHADDEKSCSRFLLEAKITAALEHPGIVPVYGLGLFHDGRPFYAMRLIQGVPLKDAILRYHSGHDGDTLGLRELLRRFLAVCDVIAYAHSRSVIHRDLKPSNILLGSYGETLVVDWGLAKSIANRGAAPPTSADFPADHESSTDAEPSTVVEPSAGDGPSAAVEIHDADSEQQTRHGTAIGTPAFMSPEQAAGQIDRLGTATDIYGLGSTLYFLLTGRSPFAGTRLEAVLDAVQGGQFPPPRRVNRAVPPALEAICLKAMATRPEDRYDSPLAIADDLQHWLADEPVSVYRAPISTRLTRWGRRHRTTTVGIGVLLVTAVLGLTVGNLLLNSANLRTASQRHRAEETAKTLARQLYINRINLAQREALDNNVTGAEQLLNLCPPEQRGWEWFHVQRISHLERATLKGHAECVNAVAFSPDGKTIVSGGGKADYDALPTDQAELIFWNAETGRERRRYVNIRGSVYTVAFSPDGTRIAIGSGFHRPAQGRLTVWETDTGRLLLDRSEPDLNVLGVEFSPDGRLVGIAAGLYSSDFAVGRLKLWNADTGELVFDQAMGVGGANALAFSPDGGQVAVAGFGVVELWDLASRQRVRAFQGHTNWVYAVAFSPDGQWLASGGWDNTVRIWDRETAVERSRGEAHKGLVLALAFSPDGRHLVSSGEDDSIRVWDPETGRLVHTLRGHAARTTGVRGLAFDPAGARLASAGGGDETVKLWDLGAEQPIVLHDHKGWVTSLAFRADQSLLATGSGDHTVLLRDPRDGHRIRTLEGHQGWVMAVDFQPGGRLIASGDSYGKLLIWDVETGRRLWRLTDHRLNIECLAFSADGQQLVSAGGPGVSKESGLGEILLWDMSTGRPRLDHRLTSPPVHDLAFQPGGTLLALACGDPSEPTADTNEVRILDAATGRLVRQLRGHHDEVLNVAFSPDGKCLASAGRDSTIRLWDPLSGQLIRTFAGPTKEDVHCLTFSPDGKRLASAGFSKQIRLWDLATGEVILSLLGHDNGIVALAFSPDGHRLASASADWTLRIWSD